MRKICERVNARCHTLSSPGVCPPLDVQLSVEQGGTENPYVEQGGTED